MRLRALLVLCICTGIAAPVCAAKPTSITFLENASNADGRAYSLYEVKCSNGINVSISAWNNRKLWCAGVSRTADCSKKQIKAAKQVCKSA